MTPELERAVKRYRQWFGSYKKSGELVKVQVWLTVNNGSIEFLTLDDSYKVKRIRRNPRVICYIGDKEGPSVSGTAEIFYGKGCHLAGVPRLLEDASVDHAIHRFPDQKANQKPQRSSHSRPPQCAKSVGRCDGSGGSKRQTVTDSHRSRSLTELRLFKFLQHCRQCTSPG